MGRIRLQICVLPWEQPGPSPSSSARKRQETVKWCEPCAEDTSMQDVCDRIQTTWARMFEPSMGPLNIRHLKTVYGDFIDLEERVVGDLFDDRGTDGNIRNSILEVYRYPPEPDELETLQRFSSLAPTSSARPRKRPLELSLQSYPLQNSRNLHREIPSIEWDAETVRPPGTATKRQRTQAPRFNGTSGDHQLFNVLEEQGGGQYHSSQTSGTQESIHQVLDSQKSPKRKHPNPYGTPTSLPLIGLQEPGSGNEIDLSAIPDSPLGRETISARGAVGGAMQLDRESTKSESPELRSSVHEVPPTDPIDASGKQPTTSAKSPKPSTTPFIFNSTSRPASILQIVEEYAKNHGLGARQTGENAADVSRTPNRSLSIEDPAHAQTVRSNSKHSRKSDPVFDPIESDTESFHEKQRMQSAKRLRSSKTPTASFTSPRGSKNAGADRRDGQFVVPSVPQSHTNKARISLGEVTSLGQRENTQEPRRDSKTANMSVQNDLQRQANHDAESLEFVQSEPCLKEQTNISRESLKEDTGYNDLMSAAQTSSQATTVWSQESINSANGTGHSDVQQIDSRVSNQEPEPHETTRFVHDVNGVFRNLHDDRFAQEAERLAEEAKEQQEKKRVREKKADEKRLAHEATEREKVAIKEAAERKPTEKRLADQKGAEEEKARAEKIAQAKKAKAKEEELAEAKRNEETRVNVAQLAEVTKTSERLAREQQTREAALAEEANKMMLVADGAKQIDAEKEEKQKARLREMAAKKQADEVKAAEQAKEAQGKAHEKKAREQRLAREKAQQLANIESKDVKQRTHQAETAQKNATALKEHSQNILADRDVQKLRSSSEVRSRSSTTSSASQNIAGPKRSMTPIVPGSSANKSSHQSPLGSSPLSSRSSGNMDAPLRSALRQTSSALRRSVSSVSFDVPPRAKLNEYIPSTPNPKFPKKINNEPASKQSSATSLPKNPLKTASNTPSKTPIKLPVPKKASDSKVTKTSAKNGKVQTKLNVTRQVKKLKGRVVDPPINRTPASKQEIVLSSGEDSSTSEEPVWQTGNAKAGPSSRKPIFPVTTSEGKKTAELKPSTPIDPVIRNIKVEQDRAVAPAILPHSTTRSDTTSLQKSTSRSPAQALSETYSLSSGSASNSDSEEEEEEEEGPQAPSSKTPTNAANGKLATGTMKGVSMAVNVGAKQSEGHLQSKASSQPSQASSSRSRSIVSMHGDGKHVDQAAEKQLQLESRQSVPKPRVKQGSSTTNGSADNKDKVINQGLDHAGRLPNGIRPAYYKYPGLSELQKLPRAVTPVVKPKMDTFSSQPLGALPLGKFDSDNSSSESDDSGSNSDGDEDVDGVSSQTSSKKRSGGYPGMRGVMKLANVVRSKFGPGQQ